MFVTTRSRLWWGGGVGKGVEAGRYGFMSAHHAKRFKDGSISFVKVHKKTRRWGRVGSISIWGEQNLSAVPGRNQPTPERLVRTFVSQIAGIGSQLAQQLLGIAFARKFRVRGDAGDHKRRGN